MTTFEEQARELVAEYADGGWNSPLPALTKIAEKFLAAQDRAGYERGFRAGAEKMRAEAARTALEQRVEPNTPWALSCNAVAFAIRALPIPEDKP